jgi:molybdenum cofactor biosynthesis protein A
MPDCGIDFVERKDLLSFEEMIRLAEIHAEMGVNKVRITGGEPFVRRDLLSFIRRLSAIKGIDDIHVTTNGTVSADKVKEFKDAGISGINLSLDTLNQAKFLEITRRDEFHKVMNTFEQLLKEKIQVKINVVHMYGVNHDEMNDLIQLAKDNPIDVRFLEEMPFNGSDFLRKESWSANQIENELRSLHPGITKLDSPITETSKNFSIPGFKGRVGIIPSFTRTICGGCNRIRVTPTGQLKTCLYDSGVLDLRHLLRTESDNQVIEKAIRLAISLKPKDGFEAESSNNTSQSRESMATIGG